MVEHGFGPVIQREEIDYLTAPLGGLRTALAALERGEPFEELPPIKGRDSQAG